jgi:hypothetical protein
MGPAVLVGIAVIVFVWCWFFAWHQAPSAWDYLRYFVVPLSTPIAAALLVAYFARLLERYRLKALETQERTRLAVAEAQQQSQIMREIIASQDRRGTAFLVTVARRLALHLRRDRTLRDADPNRPFERIAAFYYFGRFHVALMDFRATSGTAFYPRIWLENAFLRLAQHIVAQLSGDEKDPAVSMEGEAALYHYFAGAGARQVAPADGSSPPTAGAPHLFDCSTFLLRPYADDTDLERSVRMAFATFCERLDARGELYEAIPLAVNALGVVDLYAFDSLFAIWYNRPPVELPSEPPEDAPPAFRDEWGGEDAVAGWNLVRTLLAGPR